MISLLTTKFKQSGNDSTSDNFMQDQVDIAHHTSKETDAPIIILFKEKKDRTNFFRQHRKLQDITTHQFLELHVHKDGSHLNESEEDELRNTFIFMNESLQAENRKLLKLARSESKKKTISITGLDLSFEVLL